VSLPLQAKTRARRAKRTKTPSGSGVDFSDRLGHLVKDASKLFGRALQSRLSEHAIAYGHWTFLRILWKHNGISQTRLSQFAGVMAPSTFAAVRDMEKLGYVSRRQKPSNRKNVYIFLTPAGRALEAKLVPLAVDVNDTAVAGLTRKQIAEFRKVLIAMISNFES
jgi:DNA-binding MarR family transcriptional regulator